MPEPTDDLAAQVERFTELASGLNHLNAMLRSASYDELLQVAADLLAAFTAHPPHPTDPIGQATREATMIANLLHAAGHRLAEDDSDIAPTYLTHTFGLMVVDSTIRIHTSPAGPTAAGHAILLLLAHNPSEYLLTVRARVAESNGTTSPAPEGGGE